MIPPPEFKKVTVADAITLSVVVPTHGRVDLFRQTLQSIALQTSDEFELIVSDDSTDPDDQLKIKKCVDEYQRKTARPASYIFTDPGLGQAANTNQGLEAANGKLLRILHSDDLVRPGCFQWELEQFDRFPEMRVLFQDCLPFVDASQIHWNESPAMRLIDPADYFRQFLSTSTALPSGLLFTKCSLREIGGMREDWSFLCDWELFANLLLQAVDLHQFVGYATSGNYGWRLHEQSTTVTKWKQHFTEHRDLMEEWTRTLSDNKRVLFVSESDQHSFFQKGKIYRLKRLIHDVSQLTLPQFRSAKSWMKDNLNARDRRRVVRKAGTVVLTRAARQKLRLSDSNQHQALPESHAISDQASGQDWTPELVVTCMHGDSDRMGCDTCFVIPYDNSGNLWPVRRHIAAAKRIQINHPNYNRFFCLTIDECLKFVSPGCEIQFHFHDNHLMTWFGLKAIVNQLAADRFELIHQSQSPAEGTRQGHSQWQLRYRCTSNPAPWYIEPINGLTIGILTLGDRIEELVKLIQTAREYANIPYEIILITPATISEFANDQDVRQICFSERDEMGWITRKKNLICENATYSDLVICHDRFEFTPSFFHAFETWGTAYGIGAVRLKLPDGRRALDWGVVRGENHAWCQGGLLNYRDYSRFSYVPGGVTLIRKSFWEHFPWCESLYWNEHEDVELCRRIQRAGNRIALFPGQMIATRDRWVDQNPLIEFSDQHDLP